MSHLIEKCITFSAPYSNLKKHGGSDTGFSQTYHYQDGPVQRLLKVNDS